MASLAKNTKTFKLNTGAVIPAVGLGTWQSTEEGAAKNAVEVALKNGYRHIDTAFIYGNEVEVGQGIKASGIPRDEIFITTKLWNKDQRDPAKALDVSLKNLGLDYLDLYLIHWPAPLTQEGEPDSSWDWLDTYKKLQKLVDTGKVKAIGVSNFSKKKLQRLLADPDVTIKPAVNQIESHPLLPQDELYEYLQKEGILIEAYSPLGSTGAPLFKYDLVTSLAKKYNAEPAQILVSWNVQRGNVVLPKSVTDSRIISNLETLTLDKADFEELSKLSEKDGVVRTCDPKWGGVSVFD